MSNFRDLSQVRTIHHIAPLLLSVFLAFYFHLSFADFRVVRILYHYLKNNSCLLLTLVSCCFYCLTLKCMCYPFVEMVGQVNHGAGLKCHSMPLKHAHNWVKLWIFDVNGTYKRDTWCRFAILAAGESLIL